MTNEEIRQLAAAAEADFRATTISYPEWERRVAQGRYPDVKVTRWWLALDKLDRAQAALVAPAPPPPDPDPPPPPPPTGEPHVVMPTVTVPAGSRLNATPATLASVIQNAPTDTVVVLQDGDYSGSFVVARRLVFVGEPGAWPVVHGRFRAQGAGTRFAGGIVIDGAGSQWEGLWMDAQDITVEGLEVRNTYGDGVFGGGLRGKIRRNWIHHCGRVFTSVGVPQKHGIYWSGGSDGIIEDNVSEDNQGHGVQLHPYSATSGMIVRRNTILRNGSQQWGTHQGASGVILDSGSGSLVSVIERNIVAYHAKEAGIRKLSTITPGNVVKENCAYQNAGGSFPKTSSFYGAGLVDGGGNVELEPFTEASRGYGSPLYAF